jgi:hypothetical protein
MKPSQRNWGTVEALGVASIVEAATGCVYNLQQDMKGRWHVWDVPAVEIDESDPIARELEPDLT